MSTLSTLLSWSHYVELLKINDVNKVKYYIKIAEEQNLPVRKLREKVKNMNLYEGEMNELLRGDKKKINK